VQRTVLCKLVGRMRNMKEFLRAVWRWIKWPLLVLLALALVFIVLLFWRMQVLAGDEQTKVDVARIHATKLVWNDINGTLPPEPDPTENNATLVGVDSNQNGIRDDVERAIYLKYKDNKRVAIAALQYAKELQMEFTEVRNSETLVAVIQEEGRGFGCVYGNEKVVKDLVFNTEVRKQFREDIRRKYMVSYTLLNGEDCDIIF